MYIGLTAPLSGYKMSSTSMGSKSLKVLGSILISATGVLMDLRKELHRRKNLLSAN